MFSWYKAKTENKFFLKNGSAVLEQTIRLFNGKCNPIRTYSYQQLKRATLNFSQRRIIYWGAKYRLYRGVDEEEDCEFSVKVFFPFPRFNEERDLKMIANEVAVASKMSDHRNVLKLLGYCLDTELPMLVYEIPFHGNLSQFLDENDGLPFETKLKIGIGIANAVAYLHHGHLKTFVHRDIHTKQVFLDQDYGAKLFEFQASLPIPEGETHVDADVYGTKGGIASREVIMYGRYSERSDVYDFGILLSELLTGMRWRSIVCDKNNDGEAMNTLSGRNGSHYAKLKCKLDAKMLLEEKEEIRDQIMECGKLIERCISENVDERPNMVEVAKALMLIKANNSQC